MELEVHRYCGLCSLLMLACLQSRVALLMMRVKLYTMPYTWVRFTSRVQKSDSSVS